MANVLAADIPASRTAPVRRWPRLSLLWFLPFVYYPLGESARPAGDARKLSIALRQLEWADTYLNAIVNLELADHDARVAVHELRRQMTALEIHLRDLASN